MDARLAGKISDARETEFDDPVNMDNIIINQKIPPEDLPCNLFPIFPSRVVARAVLFCLT
jgi:hypothetical protein